MGEEDDEDITEMKCQLCSHHGALTINTKDIEGKLIRLCLHHQVESWGKYLKKHYSM